MENNRHGQTAASGQRGPQDSGQPIPSLQAAERKARGIWMFGLALLAFAVHASGIPSGFVFDDVFTIQHRSGVDLSHLFRFFTTDQSATFGSNFYRPVLNVWYEVAFALFRAHAPAWHVLSILLHVGCTLLVFRLALLVVEDHFTAGVAAALFAVHPAHVEVISWASAMSDPLMTALMLLSVLAFLRWMEQGKWGWWAASFAAGALCVFTKETAVVMPVVLLATALALRSRPAPAAGEAPVAAYSFSAKPGLPVLAASLPFFAISLLYLGLRHHVLGAFAHNFARSVVNSTSRATTAEMILTWPAALCFYLRHMFWPSAVVPYYPVNIVASWESQDFLLPLAGLMIAAGGLGYLLWRASGWRRFCVCMAWILVPLLPVLYLKAMVPFELVHDRFLYAPLVGFCIAVALVLQWATDRIEARVQVRGFPVIAIVLVLLLSIETLTQMVWWKNDMTLFTRALQVTPDSPRAHVEYDEAYADAYLAAGRYDEAVPLLQDALTIDPRDRDATFALGRIAWIKGDDAAAEKYFTQSLSIQPRYDVWLHLASVEMHRNQIDAAEAAVRHALAMNPGGAGAHAALGTILLARGDQAGAAHEFREELRLFPQSDVAQMGLARATGNPQR